MPPSRRRIVLRQAVAIVAAAALVGAGIVLVRGGDGDSPPAPRLPAASGGGGSGPQSHVSFLQRLIPPPAEKVEGPVAPRSIADLARRLPLERAVAQLFVFGFPGIDQSDPIFDELKRLDLGGLVLDERNYESPQQLGALAVALSTTATQSGHLPPWIMASQDGGEHSQFPDLPPARAPADYGDPASAAAGIGEAAASLRALGLNGLLDPVLDVAATDGVLGTEVLGESPQAVAAYARASVRACAAARMLCAAKHFPGVGAADTSTEEGPAQVGLSLAQLMERDVVPFAAAVRAGIPAIVVGEGLYEPDDFVTPAAVSEAIIGRLLRERLGFEGLALTDDLADPGVSSVMPVPDAAVAAVEAGADMVQISGQAGDQEAAYSAVLAAVRNGTIPESRVREALLRVLVAKRAYGLLVGRGGDQSSG